MPDMPVDTVFGYFGVMAFLLGVFLILSGAGIIKIVNLSFQAGQKPFAWGMFFLLAGIGLIYIDMNGFPRSNSQPTPAEQLPNGTTTPMVISSEPRILIDDSRECGQALTREKANRLNPEHPDWAYAGDLANEIRKSYPLSDTLNTKPISGEKLLDYRVLILLGGCDEYSTQEVLTIENFVRSGGRLLVLGSIHNYVTELFGIHFIGAPISSTEKPAQDFIVPINSQDPIFYGFNDLEIHASSAFEIKDPTKVLLWAPTNTWLDSNLDGVQDKSEKQSPFGLIARVDYGKGFAIVYSNNPLWASGYSNSYAFALNAIKWLLEN